jgi:RNA polymerase sigma factor (sigma-70 family)
MTAAQTSEVMQFLRGILRSTQVAELTDGELLGRFVEHRDEAAFAALVRSLGPLVWGVCRRVLTNTQDTEDAFQATFVVLARKAASVAPRDGVAHWLYGVARRAALQVRRSAARRHEVQVNNMPDRPALLSGAEPDLREVLDEELSLLPERDRRVILLCDLAGHSRREAARELGWPRGTVAGRLARARKRLRNRLLRRGLSFSGGALAAALAEQAASAGIPAPVLLSTINSAAGAIHARVAALAQEVLKGMVRAKQIKVGAIVLLTIVCSGFGVFLAAGQEKSDVPRLAGPGKPVESAVIATKERKPEEIAWGKEVDGLQAGLCIKDGDAVRVGGKAKAVVKLRNVSKDTLKVSAWPLWLTPPRVVDALGKRVRATMAPVPLFEIIPAILTLKPGQTVDLGKTDIIVAGYEIRDLPVPEGVVDMFTIYVLPGKYKADFAGFLQERPTLATGTLEFEVKVAR